MQVHPLVHLNVDTFLGRWQIIGMAIVMFGLVVLMSPRLPQLTEFAHGVWVKAAGGPAEIFIHPGNVRVDPRYFP